MPPIAIPTGSKSKTRRNEEYVTEKYSISQSASDYEVDNFIIEMARLQEDILSGNRDSVTIDSSTARPIDELDLAFGSVTSLRWAD